MLIILDRDGVINADSPDYIKSPAEWHALPGSLNAIAALKQAGHTVVVATNQSGIARGLYDLTTLEAIHHKMREALRAAGASLDGIFYCPHQPEDNCTCRKPKPGLFYVIQKEFNADLTQALAIGDSLRDLQAAAAVGCQPMLVKTGNGEKTAADPLLPPATLIFADLAAAAHYILRHHSRNRSGP